MVKWEYRTLRMGMEAASHLLGELGTQGWQLVSVAQMPGEGIGAPHWIFKRPVPSRRRRPLLETKDAYYAE